MANKPEIDLVKLFNGGETLSDLNSLIDGMNKREIAKALRGTFAKFKGHHQWWEHGKNLDGAWSIYDPIADRQVLFCGLFFTKFKTSSSSVKTSKIFSTSI